MREELGIGESGLHRVVNGAFGLLHLISFFTAGEGKPAQTWHMREGLTAWHAAGEIHTDIQKGFVRAEVIGWEALVEAGGYAGARDKGTLRLEGRDYLMADGDVITVKFTPMSGSTRSCARPKRPTTPATRPGAVPRLRPPDGRRARSRSTCACWSRARPHMPPGGDPTGGHSHDTIEEIYFVLEGEITIKLGDDVHHARPARRGPDRGRHARARPATKATRRRRSRWSRSKWRTRWPSRTSKRASGRRAEVHPGDKRNLIHRASLTG